MLSQQITDITLLVYPWISAWAFASARFFGIFLIFPLFSWLNLTGMLRSAVAISMAIPLAYGMGDNPVFAQPEQMIALSVLIMKEIFIGLLLGMVAGIPFWAAQTAGDVLELYRGSSASGLFDPQSSSESTVLGQLFILMALALFMQINGFKELLTVIYESYKLWPPLSPWPELSMAGAESLGLIFSKMMYLGFGLAAPLLAAMFAGELVLMFAARAGRQIQVFELSMAVKNLILVLLLPAFAAAIAISFGRETGFVTNILDYVAAGLK